MRRALTAPLRQISEDSASGRPAPTKSRAQRLAASWWPVAFGMALPLLAFFAQGDIGFSLWDEGFHWYGVQRVLAGEVPLRDFQSYDIARYYWSAPWMLLSGGTGLLSVRFGDAVLAGVVVALAVVLVRSGRPGWSTGRSTGWLLLAALTFAAWITPHYRAADSLAPLLLIGGLTRLLQQPERSRRWFEAGACLGVMSMIGINHALYGVVGLALAIGWSMAGPPPRQRPSGRALAALVLGGVAGNMPALALHVAAPGFTAAYVDFIRQLVEAGTTNITLPLPRFDAIWRVAKFSTLRREAHLALVMGAVGLVVLLCGWRLLAAIRRAPALPIAEPLPPVFVASLAASVPYLHTFLSRADLMHLALSVLPVLAAAWTFPSFNWPAARQVGALVLALTSALLALPGHPVYLLLRGEPYQRVQLHGETLRLGSQTRAELELVDRLIDTQAADGRPFYAAPYWPGAYALRRQRAPNWEIYALFPASATRQRREVERLAAANFGLSMILTRAVDDRPDLGFEQTHPLVFAHIRACSRRLDVEHAAMPFLTVWLADGQRCNPP